MTNYEKQCARKYAQRTFERATGYRCPLNAIKLLVYTGNIRSAKYILFGVGGYEYRYNNYDAYETLEQTFGRNTTAEWRFQS
jgi:hypothetical protein